jgi:tetratricopeptide (TPR) repeat protein
MSLPDSRAVILSTTSRSNVERYEAAVDLLASYFVDPLAAIDSALAEDPDFVSAHCFRAAIGVLGAERAAEPLIRESLAAAARLAGRANERERAHFEAARAWLAGDFHRAIDLYGAIVVEHPRDLLALQVAHVGDFYLGRQRMLRDRIAQVLPSWDETVPGFGYVLGMLAFGLEETNSFDRAENAGRRALALNPRDPWAVHAVTHVYEMTGRSADGIAWLESRLEDWAPDNAFAFHNFWHMALFLLERGDQARVLSLFDQRIWPRRSPVALEMVDAASLAFRLYLRGVELGARAESVADAWADPSYHGYYAFNDAHAVMAFVAAGRLDSARQVVRELERRAGEDGSNAVMVRDVGLPLARALVAFGERRYGDVVAALLPLRLVAHHFGGSNAQRDVIDQTLAEAAARAGATSLVRALAAERKLFRGEQPWLRPIPQAKVVSRPDRLADATFP